MPALDTCINTLLEAGELTPEQAGQVRETVARATEALQRVNGMSPEQAAREAARVGVAMARQAIEVERYQKALQAITLDRNVQSITAHEKGAHTGLNSLLGRDITRKAAYSNVDMRARAVLHELHRQFAEPLNALRTKNLGLTQDHVTMRDMVRELFGGKTGNENAARFADAWSQVSEYARKRFNTAGGAIPFRKDWGMPQWHDPRGVARASKAEWIDFVTPRLNRARMVDEAGLPLSDTDLRAMLERAYDRIVTDGLIDLTPGARGGKKLANRRQDSRFLVFKDGDAWLEYSDRFGRPDLFLTLTDHLDGMAHDIALLEILGPNPDQAYRVLRDIARKEGAQGARLAYTDALFNIVSGKADDTATLWWADTAGGLRNWLTSTKLGSAALSAVSDLAFIRQTSRWTGMRPLQVFHREARLLNPLNADDRLLAVQMGLGAEAWITRALAANRFTEVTGSGWSARFADFTMRASGLSALTDAGKKAFGMELWGMFGRHRGAQLADLPAGFRKELERFGIDAAAWDDIRATPTLSEQGAHFLSLENLMKRDDLPMRRRIELHNRVSEMQAELSLFAVPEPDARARAFITGGLSRGTVLGETARFVGQFKSFPVSVILSHFYRGLSEASTRDRIAYLSSLAVWTTLLGYVAMQSKEISKGRDPRPTFDDLPTFTKTLGAAFLQGGGAGIYGDFLYSGLFGANRYGGNMLTTLAGPTAGLLFSDIPRLTTGQFGDVIEGRDPKIMADLIRFTKSYTPGGSLWYARLALERGVFDQLEYYADPVGASRRQSAAVKRRERDTGQGYWWRPGRTTPNRAPSFTGD